MCPMRFERGADVLDRSWHRPTSSPRLMDTDDRVLIASEFVVGQPTAEGAVLMDMSTGECFELNRTGARIWSLLTAGRSVSSTAAAVAAEFAAPPAAVESDVRALVEEFGRRGLVKPSQR